MELLTFTLLYGGAVAAVLFALLCGEAAMFADTPVAWMHWAITSAPCSGLECAPAPACSVLLSRSWTACAAHSVAVDHTIVRTL